MQRLTAWRFASAVLRGCGSTRTTAAASYSSCYTSILINGSSPDVERSNKVRWGSLFSKSPVLVRRYNTTAAPTESEAEVSAIERGGSDLDICIQAARDDDGIIVITDLGKGMTRQEIVDSLGGNTTKFESKYLDRRNLIGEFGLEVCSLSTKCPISGKQYEWEGRVLSSRYTLYEETDPSRLIPRGMRHTLQMKPFYTDFQAVVGQLVSNHLLRIGRLLTLAECIVSLDALSSAAKQELDYKMLSLYGADAIDEYDETEENSTDDDDDDDEKRKLELEVNKKLSYHMGEEVKSNVDAEGDVSSKKI